MSSWDPQHFQQEAWNRLIPQTITDNALAVAEKRIHPDLPPVFTLKHLSLLSGVRYGVLRHVVSREHKTEFYKTFKFKKAFLGSEQARYRYISIPSFELMQVQRWIHLHILSKIPPHTASYAFSASGGIIKAALPHCGCKWMLKFDVTNFFEAILETDVYEVFRSLGYEPLISFEMARLCTRLRTHNNPRADQARTFAEKLPYSPGELGHLPQGAPSSPLLSNLVARKLDETLTHYARRNRLIYTRYADDLVFSSQEIFSRQRAVEAMKTIHSIMRDHKLYPNLAKSKIVTPGARKIVLGLLVNGMKPALTKEYKQEIMMHLHFIQHPQVGLKQHLAHKKFASTQGFYNHLRGKITFARLIEPEWAEQVWKIFQGFPWHDHHIS